MIQLPKGAELTRYRKEQTERWRLWQYLKAVIEHKRGVLTYDEAAQQMAYWSGVDVDVCSIMLLSLRREHALQLRKAKPKTNVPSARRANKL